MKLNGTWTFQVAPEAGWARRKGPVTLRARLISTAGPLRAASLPTLIYRSAKHSYVHHFVVLH